MKLIGQIFLGLVGLAALAVAALILVGGGGRAEIESHIEIARPPAKVFPWLTEPERMKKWIGGLREIAPTTNGPPRMGSRAHEVMFEENRLWPMDSEITMLEPNQRVFVHITSEFFDIDLRYKLEEKDGKTALRVENVAQYKTTLAKLVEPLVTPSAKKKGAEDLARLKTLVEAE